MFKKMKMNETERMKRARSSKKKKKKRKEMKRKERRNSYLLVNLSMSPDARDSIHLYPCSFYKMTLCQI